VRVESKQAFLLKGVHGEIHGLFSLTPDFQHKVPMLWRELESRVVNRSSVRLPTIGVIDVTHSHFDGSNIQYWAGVELGAEPIYPQLPSLVSSQLDTLSVPSQTYAVLKHRGPVVELPKSLEWFMIHWLPNSSYRGVDGFELECYPAEYNPLSSDAVMEYWVPIA
jgi:AraC family transcriptional regulator